MSKLDLSALADSIIKTKAPGTGPSNATPSAPTITTSAEAQPRQPYPEETEKALAALRALARPESQTSSESMPLGTAELNRSIALGFTSEGSPLSQRMESSESAHEQPHEDTRTSIWLGSLPDPEPADGRPFPKEPANLAATGLTESMVEQLILKAIYFRGDITGGELAEAIGLKFSILEPMVENFRRLHLITVKRSLGMGNVSAVFALAENGRGRAQECLETCQYSGVAPVPLEQYRKMVLSQRLPDSWLTMDMLRAAYGHMVVTDELLGQIGPAVNSGKSFLIYGQPGNGKTFLAEALFGLHKEPVYIPYAIEHQGQIIQMYDPIYHTKTEEGAAESSVFRRTTAPYDRRWFRAKRPFIVSGGELSLESLDLAYNPVAKTFDAPLHMKANNGIYLIDDFGRQKVTPAEVLNRWIVPMEKRFDYLTFQNGTKIETPFEVFLVFSTNLNPEKLGDEAFLRRIQYKMLMRSPSEEEFKHIFCNFAKSKNLEFDPSVADSLLEKRYRATGKPRRRCQPRDILTHAIDYIRFERRPFVLSEEVVDHAFLSCFIDTSENG